jgi:hypothetical protein
MTRKNEERGITVRLNTQNLQSIINIIWTVADDVLINKFLENQYQDVILPMTVLRRLDLALEPTKDKVLKTHNEFKSKIDNISGLLTSEQHGSGLAFYNTLQYTMKKLLADPKNIDANFLDYLNGYSENVQDIISKFKFRNKLKTFEETGITFSLIEKFCNPKVELSPDKISPMAMGYMFEDLIRRFNRHYIDFCKSSALTSCQGLNFNLKLCRAQAISIIVSANPRSQFLNLSLTILHLLMLLTTFSILILIFEILLFLSFSSSVKSFPFFFFIG